MILQDSESIVVVLQIFSYLQDISMMRVVRRGRMMNCLSDDGIVEL